MDGGRRVLYKGREKEGRQFCGDGIVLYLVYGGHNMNLHMS